MYVRQSRELRNLIDSVSCTDMGLPRRTQDLWSPGRGGYGGEEPRQKEAGALQTSGEPLKSFVFTEPYEALLTKTRVVASIASLRTSTSFSALRSFLAPMIQR